MKLFLASSLIKTISLLAARMPRAGQGCSVIFIRNAADEEGEPWWVRSDREAFTSLGCKIVDVDLNLLKHLHEHGSVRILKDRRNDLYEIRKIEQ